MATSLVLDICDSCKGLYVCLLHIGMCLFLVVFRLYAQT